MRRFSSLVTSLIACMTVAFVVFNKTMTEPENLTPKTAGVETSTSYTWSYMSSLEANARSEHAQLHRHVTPSLAEVGGRRSVPEMSENTLMVTRIPGAGAELLVLILQHLQGLNTFKHVRMPPGDEHILTNLQQELLVEDITTIIRREAVPLTFDADARFLNFSTFGRQAPTFISMVRDPLDPTLLQRYKKRGGILPRYCGSIAYFCGQDPRCTRQNRTWAMTEAKANVEHWYPVVGLLEHMGSTLKTLERKFPYFFKGATDVYSKLNAKKRNRNPGKTKMVTFDGNILREPLVKEVEFYLWLKSRLLYPNSGNG